MAKMPSFLPKQPWRKLKTSINVLRAFSTDYSNQSRGSLPRFFSPTIPSSKRNGHNHIAVVSLVCAPFNGERGEEVLKINSIAVTHRFEKIKVDYLKPSGQMKFLIIDGMLAGWLNHGITQFKGGVVRVQGDEYWHMTKVLRLGVNDRIELFNGKGSLVEGSIEKVDRTGLEFVAVTDSVVVHPREPQWDVFAAFGTLKGGRADWLIEKCTELGASSVTPLLTERSPSISENRVDRLQRVVLAATKQCQRLHEMTLNPPVKICSIAPTVAQSKLSFVAAAEATPIISALKSSVIEARGTLIIGPEGDFTEEELSMIKEAGATAVGLGPHRLRVETATIALLATLIMWSDSQQ